MNEKTKYTQSDIKEFAKCTTHEHGDCMTDDDALAYGIQHLLCQLDWPLAKIMAIAENQNIRDDAIITALRDQAYYHAPQRLPEDLAGIWDKNRIQDWVINNAENEEA